MQCSDTRWPLRLCMHPVCSHVVRCCLMWRTAARILGVGFCFVGWGAVGHALRTWRKAVSVVLACLYVTVRSSYIAFLFGFVVRARLILFSAPSSGTEWRRRLININRLTNRSAFCMLFPIFRMFNLVLILSGSG